MKCDKLMDSSRSILYGILKVILWFLCILAKSRDEMTDFSEIVLILCITLNGKHERGISKNPYEIKKRRSTKNIFQRIFHTENLSFKIPEVLCYYDRMFSHRM